MGSAPFAGRMPIGGAPERAASAEAPELTFDLPEGWAQAENDPFSLHAFTVRSGGAQGRATITAAGGDLRANVNRWRGQLGLEPWSAEEMEKNAETITVGGETGRLVHLTQAGDDPSRQAILGSIVPKEGRLWFFKLTGPASLAEEQKDRFRAFVESVKFDRAE